jgi:Tfp pilus assembly protein PilX
MKSMVMRLSGEQGVALIIAVMSTTLMLTLGGALILLSSSETAIAANFRAAHEATYAADAAIERALTDLRNQVDWTPILAGSVQSSFADGVPSGTRTLADGSTIDLGGITNLASCQKASVCSDAEVAAVTTDRPWGANNPRWTLFAYGPLANTLGSASVRSLFYVLALVGDDPSENDGNPSVDGLMVADTPNPGNGIVVVRGEAFGPRGAHKAVEATIARLTIPPADPAVQPSTELRVLSWREVR